MVTTPWPPAAAPWGPGERPPWSGLCASGSEPRLWSWTKRWDQVRRVPCAKPSGGLATALDGLWVVLKVRNAQLCDDDGAFNGQPQKARSKGSVHPAHGTRPGLLPTRSRIFSPPRGRGRALPPAGSLQEPLRPRRRHGYWMAGRGKGQAGNGAPRFSYLENGGEGRRCHVRMKRAHSNCFLSAGLVLWASRYSPGPRPGQVSRICSWRSSTHVEPTGVRFCGIEDAGASHAWTRSRDIRPLQGAPQAPTDSSTERDPPSVTDTGSTLFCAGDAAGDEVGGKLCLGRIESHTHRKEPPTRPADNARGWTQAGV